MDVFGGGQVPLVGRGEEAGDDGRRPVASADDGGGHLEPLVEVLVDLLARAIGVGEEPAGDEGHVIAVLLVEAGHELTDGPVVVPRVLQCSPTERPGHATPRPPSAERVAERSHVLGRVGLGLVDALGTVARHLDLVHADDRVEGQIAPREGRRRPWVHRLAPVDSPASQCAGRGRPCG